MSVPVDLCGDTGESLSSMTRSADRHIVTVIGTDIVHQSDLERLSPGTWINNAIVSSSMTIMNNRGK